MNAPNLSNFLYLNREGRWLDFNWRALELGEDGALRLSSLPIPRDGFLDLSDAPTPDGPGGLALTPWGSVYTSDTRHHRIDVVDCDGSHRPLPCINGPGELPGRLRFPRGLLYHSGRRALIVADSGNDRLQLFGVPGENLVDVWGGSGAEAGRFRQPTSLAGDHDGNVYVVDHGNRRVQQFDSLGTVVDSFWNRASQAHALTKPVEVAVWGDEVFILNERPTLIAVFDTAGRHLGNRKLAEELEAVGLWIDGNALYLGDNAGRRLLKFTREGVLVGEATGYRGPVAALSGDSSGRLWLHPGDAGKPLRLETGKAFVKRGLLWGGPFGRRDRLSAWHRLQALGRPLGPNLHFQVFVHTADQITPGPPSPTAGGGFDPRFWRGFPVDVPDLVLDVESRFVWVGATFEGEGFDSPRLEQIRLAFDHQSYTRHLPALYQKKSPRPRQQERFLSLFESFFVDAEEEIGRLGQFFDAAAAPAAWLGWLAGWLGIELDEEWSEEEKRNAIRRAFAASGKRGTAAGLRDAILFETGVEASIEEPLMDASWWALPGADDDQVRRSCSRLGQTTRLVASPADGTVLGTSAVLNRSRLSSEVEFGAPLFQGLAHRFSVRVHRAQVADPRRLERVKAVIEREKPAHTDYHLCIVEPHLSLGLQSRIGVDTVVGGSLRSSRLGLADATPGIVLAGQGAGRIGVESLIGETTRLGGGIHPGHQNCGGAPPPAEKEES